MKKIFDKVCDAIMFLFFELIAFAAPDEKRMNKRQAEIDAATNYDWVKKKHAELKTAPED